MVKKVHMHDPKYQFILVLNYNIYINQTLQGSVFWRYCLKIVPFDKYFVYVKINNQTGIKGCLYGNILHFIQYRPFTNSDPSTNFFIVTSKGQQPFCILKKIFKQVNQILANEKTSLRKTCLSLFIYQSVFDFAFLCLAHSDNFYCDSKLQFQRIFNTKI